MTLDETTAQELVQRCDPFAVPWQLIATALAQARRKGAEQMRERAAFVSETRCANRIVNVSWSRQAEEAGRLIAIAIRALPLEGDDDAK